MREWTCLLYPGIVHAWKQLCKHQNRTSSVWAETFCGEGKTDWWRIKWLLCHWGHRGWQGGLDTLNVCLNCSFGTWKKHLDLPKVLHSAANKSVLQVAVPEHLELMGRNKRVEESWVNLTHPLDRKLKLLLFISPLSQSSLCSLGTSGSWNPAVLASREGWRFGNLIQSFPCPTPGVSCELLPQLRVPSLEMERKIKF